MREVFIHLTVITYITIVSVVSVVSNITLLWTFAHKCNANPLGRVICPMGLLIGPQKARSGKRS